MSSVSAKTENGTCTVFLSGKIDSVNALAVEQEIMALLKPGALVLDAEALEYISSAGLRVLLRLRRSHPGMKIIGVNPQVYEILDMTGFTAMIPVEKAFRRISTEGCEVIGHGAKGDVLRLNGDTVIKIYKDPDSLEEIRHEREMAKKAFIAGIPTAISFDVVKVGEDYASVFELINAQSLAKLLHEHPDEVSRYAPEYAGLLHLVHSTRASDALPSFKKTAEKWAEYVAGSDVLSSKAGKKLVRLIKAVPENDHMIHGDCHAKNIMLQNGEMILIDMDTLACADPVFELGTMYFSYMTGTPESTMDFLGISRETAEALWKQLLQCYYETKDSAVLTDKENKAAVIGLTRFLYHTLRHNDGSEAARAQIDHAAGRLEQLTASLESLVQNAAD